MSFRYRERHVRIDKRDPHGALEAVRSPWPSVASVDQGL
jgi:hypothetical protein